MFHRSFSEGDKSDTQPNPFSGVWAAAVTPHRRNGFEADYAGMLEQQLEGKIDAWDIRWYWSIFNRKGVSLFPKYSLVKNIGFDGSGIHCFDGQQTGDEIYAHRFQPAFPDKIVVNKEARKTIINYWRLLNNHDIVTRVRRKLLQILR